MLLNRHTHNIWFGMNQDHTFVRALEMHPSLFHMQLLPSYLDEVAFDKEFTLCHLENKKTSVSYAMPALTQRYAPLKTSDVGLAGEREPRHHLAQRKRQMREKRKHCQETHFRFCFHPFLMTP
jgi:hypothetical protein